MTEGTDMNQIEKVARPDAAIENLTHHQQQSDMDGTFVKVSRQALDEVLSFIAAMQPAPQWQGIESAPDLERVIVAGWNPHSGNVRGYWWYGEDVVSNGRAIEHPRATHWRPFNNPAFPTPPAGGSDAE